MRKGEKGKIYHISLEEKKKRDNPRRKEFKEKDLPSPKTQENFGIIGVRGSILFYNGILVKEITGFPLTPFRLCWSCFE